MRRDRPSAKPGVPIRMVFCFPRQYCLGCAQRRPAGFLEISLSSRRCFLATSDCFRISHLLLSFNQGIFSSILTITACNRIADPHKNKVHAEALSFRVSNPASILSPARLALSSLSRLHNTETLSKRLAVQCGQYPLCSSLSIFRPPVYVVALCHMRPGDGPLLRLQPICSCLCEAPISSRGRSTRSKSLLHSWTLYLIL